MVTFYNAEMNFMAGPEPIPTIDFESRRTDPRGPLPGDAKIRYRPVEGPVEHAAPGTIEHFLMERYILYTQDEAYQLINLRDRGTLRRGYSTKDPHRPVYGVRGRHAPPSRRRHQEGHGPAGWGDCHDPHGEAR